VTPVRYLDIFIVSCFSFLLFFSTPVKLFAVRGSAATLNDPVKLFAVRGSAAPLNGPVQAAPLHSMVLSSFCRSGSPVQSFCRSRQRRSTRSCQAFCRSRQRRSTQGSCQAFCRSRQRRSTQWSCQAFAVQAAPFKAFAVRGSAAPLNDPVKLLPFRQLLFKLLRSIFCRSGSAAVFRFTYRSSDF
jgi:hypothetical protein